MKLIVGLGNPGDEYSWTRHNMGFYVIDNYAKCHDVNICKKKFNGLYGEFIFNDEKIILLKPQSFMNLSGEVVKKFVDFYKIDIENILVICDDLDLPFLKIRFRPNGSSGGHNGLKNIETNLGSSFYKRMKLGIANNKLIDTKDYVLGKLTLSDRKRICDIDSIINKMLDDFLQLSFDKLMCKYN